MLPTAYEFHWDTGHIAFLGLFYGVLTAVFATLARAALRSWRDLRHRREDEIAWHEAFSDLPADRRHCRHAFDGPAAGRVCGHGFACDTCAGHAELARADVGGPGANDARRVAGPRAGERLHHRGHTWVEARADGTYDVGVDDLLRSCVGRPDRVTVPGPGERVQAGAPAAELQRGRLRARLVAPLTGTVVATGDYDGGRLYRVKPLDEGDRLECLLRPAEARTWRLRELEMLQERLGAPGAGPALADGGELVADLVAACPDADWDAIIGDLCLEP
jgi:glycine cleavage system H lipoate-binding protein